MAAASASAEDVSKKQKLGSFQAMDLAQPLLNGLNRMSYKVPTPVQRKTLPLALAGMDVVCMARTGSGKTAAFLIPMVQRIKSHESTGGIRAIILSPTRELAVQTFRFAKDMAKFTDIRVVSIIGGDPLEKQFEALSMRPDCIVATPGRLMHHLREIKTLKLKTVKYLVFDEADRLFEMGFAEQLNEIIKQCPEERQTLLFSATMPKQLIQFTRAGLREPQLIRLETDTKMSEELRMAFFTVRTTEKIAGLLYLVRKIIPANDMTIVFTATKHHSEFIHALLNKVGVTSTVVYGSMDQDARESHLKQFRNGQISYLIVTDLAARGIDVPLLNNVINLHFPPTSKLFVHRCGRAARQGRIGYAFSLIEPEEMAFMTDVHLFLGKPVENVYHGNDNGMAADNREKMVAKIGAGTGKGNVAGTSEVTLSSHTKGYTLNEMTPDMIHTGLLPQDILDREIEFIAKSIKEDDLLKNLFKVSENAMKQYRRTRTEASHRGISMAKKIIQGNAIVNIHPVIAGEDPKQCSSDIVEKNNFIRILQTFRPSQTVLESGIGTSTGSTIIKNQGKKGLQRKADAALIGNGETTGVSAMRAMRKSAETVLVRNKEKQKAAYESIVKEQEAEKRKLALKERDDGETLSKVGPLVDSSMQWATLEAEAEEEEKMLAGIRDEYDNHGGDSESEEEKVTMNKKTGKKKNKGEDTAALQTAGESKEDNKASSEHAAASGKVRLSIAERKKLKKKGGSTLDMHANVRAKTLTNRIISENTDEYSKKKTFKDDRFYMSYGIEDEHEAYTEEALQPKSGLRTAEAQQAALMESALLDVAPDDAMELNKQRRIRRWDDKKKKFVRQSIEEIQNLKGVKRMRLDTGTIGKSKVPAGEMYNKWAKRTRREINTDTVTTSRGDDADDRPIPNVKFNKNVRSELKSEQELRKAQKVRQDNLLKNMPKDKRRKIEEAKRAEKKGGAGGFDKGSKGKSGGHKGDSRSSRGGGGFKVSIGSKKKGGFKASSGGKGGKGRR